MRTHACCWFFCAVALLVCPSAGAAAEGGAEYRAPVSGLKLTPPQTQANSADRPATPATGQTVAPGQPAPSSAGSTAASPAWAQPSGMTTYSGMQAPQGRGDAVGASGVAPAQNAAQGRTQAGSPAMPQSASQSMSPSAPQTTPQDMPSAGNREAIPQEYAPYSSMPWGGRDRDIVSGTSRLEGGDSEESGYVEQYRDPETGDIVTSVVPPKQPQQDYGTFFIAPQIYPDRRRPHSGSYPGGSAWPGGQSAPPTVIWMPGQQTSPPHRHERPRQGRRHADEGYGDSGYGPGRSAPSGRNGEGYGRGGYPDASPYDRRDGGRPRTGEGDR